MFSLVSLLVVVVAAVSATGNAQTCPEQDQIHCKTNDKCTRIRYICDGDNDCGDNSDEDPELCSAWLNRGCSRNEATCYRYGDSSCKPISLYCDLADPPCEGDVDPRLCQMLKDGLLQDLDSIVITNIVEATGEEGLTELELSQELGGEFLEQVAHTIKHEDCPQLFTRVGEACVSVFYPGNVTWGAANEFCHTIGGELLMLNRDYSFYATLVQHLKQYQMTADFWLGGTRENATSSWSWIDTSLVSESLPYWAITYNEACTPRIVNSLTTANTTRIANQGHCYHFNRAPAATLEGQCLALTYESYYQMADVSCLAYKSPLCIVKKD